MDQRHDWRPSKYVDAHGRWRSSRDGLEVGVGSRIMADKVAGFYQEAVARHARGRLLDLGCGKAPLLGLYSRYVESVTRMDWGQSHGTEFVDIEHDLNQPLPLEPGSFETVILSDVLEHLRVPADCLREIHRILTPGGKAIINVPFYYWLHETPYDYYRYTRFGLEYLAGQAALHVETLDALGGAPEVFLDLLGKILARNRITRQVAKLFPPAYGAAMKVRPFQRYARATSDQFPLAYGMVLSKR